MKSRVFALGVCALVLAGLLAAYFTLGKRNEVVEEPEDEAPYYLIIDHEEEEVASFSVSSGGETLTYLPDPDSETGWQLDFDGKIRLDPYFMRSLLRGVTAVGTETIVAEEAADRAAFGLDPAQATTVIRYKDGTENTVLLGRKTPDGDNYYITREGDPAVYLIDKYAGEKYEFKFNDMVDMAVPAVNTEALQYVYINDEGRELELAPVAETNEELAAYGIVSMAMSKPYPGRNVYLSTFTENVLGGLEDMRFDGFVGTDTANLAAYGLDNPTLQVVLTDDGNGLHLLVGAAAENGQRYAMLAGDSMVFTIDDTKLKSFRDVDVFAFMERFVALVGIDTVERLIINDGETRTLVLNATTDENGVTAYAPTVGDKAVDEGEFKNFYQALIGLNCEAAIADFAPEAGATFAVAYRLLAGGTHWYEYYDYNDNFYAVLLNGDWFAVSKQSVNTVVRMLERLTAAE